MKIEERYEWMSADERFAYQRDHRGWYVYARSVVEGGAGGADREHLRRLGIINAAGRIERDWPTRRALAEAVETAFAETERPTVTAVRRRPLPLAIEGLEPFAVLRHGDRWVLTTVRAMSLMHLPLLNRMLAEHGLERPSDPWRDAHDGIRDEWYELTRSRFRTRREAVESLVEWLGTLGIRPEPTQATVETTQAPVEPVGRSTPVAFGRPV